MNDVFAKLGETLLAGQNDEIRKLTQEAMDSGISPQEILEKGMMPAMEDLGDRFSRGEAYLPELLLAADTMSAATEILRPAIIRGDVKPKATLVIGTVEGDIHDLGKNLVKMMFEGAGFKTVDLGVNVVADKFVEACAAEKPDLVGLSALLTTTMAEMEKVAGMIRESHPETKILVGGVPITQAFADRIGAAGYAPDAPSAVKVGKELLGL